MSVEDKRVRESFSKQWGYFRDTDRTWYQTLEERKETLLEEIDNKDLRSLRNKVVLDLGCGNGTVSKCFSELGCKVYGMDISTSVYKNKKRYTGINFVQASAFNLPFSNRFDIVYSKGVLHHTGDTRRAFLEAVKYVKQKGIFYLWLYSKSKGFKHILVKYARPFLVRIPINVREIIFVPIALLRMLTEDKNFNESLLTTFDFFTPQREEFDENEIMRWFKDAGFTNIRITNRVKEGFGICCERV